MQLSLWSDGILVRIFLLSMCASTGWSRIKRHQHVDTQDHPTSDGMNSEENEMEPLVIDRGPYFDKSASKNVTALVGKTTYLNCRI
ncbi:unnamed protein product, partial [Callosobruchus maculatus]